MPDYAFSTLSDHDFECLVRDLLQKALGVQLESFARGKDQGIDLRHCHDLLNTVIIQCKHYVRSGFPRLKSHMRREAVKVRALKPSRYILATSVSLTPTAKAELMAILAPFCRSPHDIYGAADLNNLLGIYPEIEQQHFKLWLTSTPILQRILHSGVFAESEAEIETIRSQISRWVETDALHKAADILETQKYCVISGPPGVGKTTLARTLLMQYAKRGWDVVSIGDNIAEAWEILDPHKKQVFYFDDFLGRTGLKGRTLRRNEDQRLLSFIAALKRRDSTRLILTTREYILNQAKALYEGLEDPRIEAGKCVLQLDDYSTDVRAKILYNHLYFSDLPESHVQPFADEYVFLPIISHKNFGPRIVEWMTQHVNTTEMTPKEYQAEFLRNLDNPVGIWAHAFEGHLSTAAQDLLLAYTSLGEWARLDDLERAFEAFYGQRTLKYGYLRGARDFGKALKEVTGSFLTTFASRNEIVVGFQNPSIQQFMEDHLRQHSGDSCDLLEFACFPDQSLRIWEVCKSRQYDRPFCERALNSLYATRRVPSVHISKLLRDWEHTPYSRENQYYSALHMWELTQNNSSDSLLDELTAELLSEMEQGFEDSDMPAIFIDFFLGGDFPHTCHTTSLFETAVCDLLMKVKRHSGSLDDFLAAAKVAKKYPTVLCHGDLEVIRQRFTGFLEWKIEELHDSDWPRMVLDELGGVALLEQISSALQVDCGVQLDRLEECFEELGHVDYAPSHSTERRTEKRAKTQCSSGTLSMFETLRHTTKA